MNQVVKIVFLVMLSMVPIIGISQTTDSQLAAHYYQNQEYEKALLYYSRLYSKQTNASNYNYLFKCLVKLENYSEARKLSKRHVRIDPINQKAKVDYGYTYGLEGNAKMQSKEFKKIIKSIAPNYLVINELAVAFLDIKKNQEALDVYQQGRSIMKNTYPFNTEIADIYYRMERYNDMTDE
ncbi:MAG: tetratricopeptide (TPR) repeat protein, partial [Salibacteraceae bacterium]